MYFLEIYLKFCCRLFSLNFTCKNTFLLCHFFRHFFNKKYLKFFSHVVFEDIFTTIFNIFKAGIGSTSDEENLKWGLVYTFQTPSGYGTNVTEKKYPNFTTKIPIFTYSIELLKILFFCYNLRSSGHYSAKLEKISRQFIIDQSNTLAKYEIIFITIRKILVSNFLKFQLV
jgi:hypothetical protein